ncbi:YgdI/YgdR family lipoprotein [Halopseudomonas sabulinigri]|uniref:YgdI/YgdR family lipoprotein n=1 Tax=Halopseudomonas sabulinigri TaxID=472181 RepID=A0ABP9ZU92_9GAMM
MKHAVLIAFALLAAITLTACSSEYIISTTDGQMIPTDGKPKFNEETGMVEYEDAEGRKATIMRSDVKSVMER